MSSDTGYFWFFSSSNVELVVKVLDGRAVNGHFWVFYGALSDVEYTITVADTQTGRYRTYTNANGNLASVADTTAFDGSGGVPNVNVSGTWDALLTSGNQQAAATFTLSQNGTSVTGTAFVVGGSGGSSLTGVVQGQAFTFTSVQSAPCPGTFYGTGIVNAAANQMTGSYSGSSCSGPFSASFTATKR
jgi:hypothetical protein